MTHDEHAQQLWMAAAESLRGRVSTGDWAGWFTGIAARSFDGQTLVLSCGSSFARSWIQDRFHSLIQESVSAVAGTSIVVLLQVVSRETPGPGPGPENPLQGPISPVDIVSAQIRQTIDGGQPPSFNEQSSVKKVVGVGAVATDEGPTEPVTQAELQAELGGARMTGRNAGDVPRAVVSAVQAPDVHAVDLVHNQPLYPRYRFDTFVIGEGNQLAHAAALSVAESPGMSYNPLLIHGGTGLGKTHLLHAIGHYAQETRPGIRIGYVTTEHFINRFIQAISRRDQSRERFKQYFRGIDLLLMDDIQFLSGKAASLQEELFHTFNTLHESGRQIVLTSDVEPSKIPQLEERLKSRFAWGLITDIESPDRETRIAILMKKARVDGYSVPMEVLTEIGERISTNVRELEGALTRVVGYASLRGRPLTVELAAEVLQTFISDRQEPVTIDRIQRVVCQHFDVTLEELKGSRRTQEVTMPRQIAMYLSRVLVNASSTHVGAKFERDHSTVLSAERKIDKLIKEGGETYDIVERLTETIKGGSSDVR